MNKSRFAFKLIMFHVGFLYAFLVFHLETRAQVSQRDAFIVLAAIRSSKLAMTEGVVKFRVHDSVVPESWVEEFEILAHWKGDSVRFVELSPDGTERRVSIRHHGELLHKQFGDGSAAIDTASKGYAYFLFDPRILGACPTLTPSLLASECLFPSSSPGQGWETELLSGSESVRGIDCVVLLWKKPGIVQKFWIETKESFRVIQIFDYNNSSRTVSTYGKYGDFPSDVHITKLDGSGSKFRETTFEVISFHQKEVDTEMFTISGLHMEIGDRLTDQRIHRTIGYWNGQGLSPTRQDAENLATLEETKSRRGWLNLPVFFAICVVVVVSVRFMISKYLRAAS